MTIQACSNSAAAYDTVIVAAGLYHEKVFLPNGVMLFSGDGPSATVINSQAFLVPWFPWFRPA